MSVLRLADAPQGSVTAANPVPVSNAGAYAATVTHVSEQSAVVTAAVAAATMPAVAAKTNYVTGFEITGGGATAASLIEVVLSGLLGGDTTYVIAVPAGATLGITPLLVNFIPAIPASAVNTAIAITAPSFGAGNTKAMAAIHGYVL